ncbi:MAG: T9SS type A sorting domain-containing protein [Ignavibacteria bacterium]|nr:T9SS type A sorting domain-containing protein [Ignavibacteria bacterium]
MSSSPASYRAAIRRLVFGIVAVSALLLSSIPVLHAQISTTPFRQFQDTYVPVSGGTVLCSAGTILVPMTSSSLDDGYWTINLPFTFRYNNLNQTVLYLCTNGYLTFGSGSTSLTGAISGGQGSQGAICGLSRDLDLRSGNPAPEVSFATTGLAPDRVFTIQYKSVKTYPATTYPADNLNFQIKLYETSNRVDVVYGTFTTTASTTAQVGLRGSTNAMVNVSNRMVTSGLHTWPSSVSGTANTSACAYNSTLFPSSGWTYSWGCNIPSGSADMQIVDGNGNAQPYVYSPGTIFVKYSVSFPLATAYTIAATLKFYRIGDPSGVPVFTTSFDINKPVGVASGMSPVNIDLAPGFYRIAAAYRMQNNCGTYEDYALTASILSLAPGTEPCLVWPGDANNDGTVNFGDRSALNRYIAEANLRSFWLQGPARYRPDAASNPTTYYTWEAQPSVPWSTPLGCYMDTDGNGMINNFDYLAMKRNWLRSHGGSSKTREQFDPRTFDMDQNYPNPFNPSTTLRFSVPEASEVTLTVVDVLGRTVATLVSGSVEAGTHSVSFDASSLESGTYIAAVSMTGRESGLTFSKTLKMTLAK